MRSLVVIASPLPVAVACGSRAAKLSGHGRARRARVAAGVVRRTFAAVIAAAALVHCGAPARSAPIARADVPIAPVPSSTATAVLAPSVSTSSVSSADTRVHRCNVLIDAVNAATADIEQQSKALGSNENDFERMASTLLSASDAIAAADVSGSETLVRLRASYARVVERMALSMRDAGVAITKHDRAAAERAMADFKAADRDEDGVRAEITQYCTAAAK